MKKRRNLVCLVSLLCVFLVACEKKEIPNRSPETTSSTQTVGTSEIHKVQKTNEATIKVQK
ncbi:hypothetical protein E0L10_05840 [Enterococcus durans]|uniref:hypothetical protein n=1 Tax=Enterococcus durans TaxID=53345 RepID=UPI0014305ABA|nr:hypothetical protein [Enterococcus durans]NJE63675.1 hypothetical protein [Enterococcus durans]